MSTMQESRPSPETAVSSSPVGIREAAEKLELSLVQVRRLIHAGWLRALRDNRGHWRVHLPRQKPDIALLTMSTPEEVDAILTNILMDELSYLEDQSDVQDAEIERLGSLVERQNELLERTMDAGERVAAERDAAEERSVALAAALDRSIELLEAAVGGREKVGPTSAPPEAILARATELLEAALTSAEQAESRSARLRDMLERAMALAEGSPRQPADLGKLDAMLERAMSLADTADQGRQLADNRLRERDAQMERTFALLEKGLKDGERETRTQPKQNRLFSVFSRR